MAILIYDGSAKDQEVIPQRLVIGQGGKPIKRKVASPSKNVQKDISVYNLWGMRFPKGQALEVVDPAMIKKAANLQCFEVQLQPDEPLLIDKKWVAEARMRGRIEILEKTKKADAPEVDVQGQIELEDSAYDQMKRTELLRLAGNRGLSVGSHLKKKDIIDMLKDQDEEAHESDEEPAEMMLDDGDWVDKATDVG